VLAATPTHFDATHLLGVMMLQKGDPAGAVQQIGRAIAINPRQAIAYNNRGIALNDLKQYDNAISDFDQAIALQPQNAEANYNKGRAQFAAGRSVDALGSLRQAVRLRPNYPEAHQMLGTVHAAQHDQAAALQAFDQAATLQPQWPDAHFNRGSALAELQRPHDALAAFDKAIALNPSHADALNNRGNVLRLLKRYDEALADFTRAAQARPGFVGAEVNKAMVLMALGRMKEGWPAYEWRFLSPELAPLPQRFTQPRWTGAEDVADKTLLLVAEQGLGDTLQFCRYARLAADKGARVILEVQPPLKRLLSSLDGVSAVYADNEPLPPVDFYCPMLSLPLAFNTVVNSVPSAPYLKADAAQTAEWARRIADESSLRVGLVWAGSPRKNMPQAHAIDKKRSLHLSAFKPFADIQGVRFFSLQKGEPATQLTEMQAAMWGGPAIIDHTDQLNDFADTAALVANLDLIITCDTSVAHLAGGLGKPVWILNRTDGCWRWLHGRTDTPWYPSAKLFQQQTPGEWGDVIAAAARELRVTVAG
ncbi:MAG: tetratricopeptide repeat protein, partial [Rhodospirillaceae bacterium]|nr:tetratricopeptide repeat protein [Rhodospirillaceae bacterium]